MLSNSSVSPQHEHRTGVAGSGGRGGSIKVINYFTGGDGEEAHIFVFISQES